MQTHANYALQLHTHKKKKKKKEKKKREGSNTFNFLVITKHFNQCGLFASSRSSQ